MPAYLLDLRTRVVAAYRQPGARPAAVAARFGVSVSFLKKLLRHERQPGSLAPKPASGGRARYLDAEAQAWLVAYVGQQPDATLAELGQAWQAQGGPLARPASGRCCRSTTYGAKKVITPASVTRPAS
ncbi:MAG: hypothetical protein ACRYG7_47365 [Janthinobacterium lividum]